MGLLVPDLILCTTQSCRAMEVLPLMWHSLLLEIIGFCLCLHSPLPLHAYISAIIFTVTRWTDLSAWVAKWRQFWKLETFWGELWEFTKLEVNSYWELGEHRKMHQKKINFTCRVAVDFELIGLLLFKAVLTLIYSPWCTNQLKNHYGRLPMMYFYIFRIIMLVCILSMSQSILSYL